MGCCFSEPFYDIIESQSVPRRDTFQRRPRSVSFYIENDSDLKKYEEKVLIATMEAYEQDSNIY